MTKSKKQLKLTVDNLLAIIANENNLTIQQLTSKYQNKYQLKSAVEVGTITTDSDKINPKTNQQYTAKGVIWHTDDFIIESTKYGRIKSIQPRSQVNLVRTPIAATVFKKPRKHNSSPKKHLSVNRLNTTTVPVTYRKRRVAGTDI